MVEPDRDVECDLWKKDPGRGKAIDFAGCEQKIRLGEEVCCKPVGGVSSEARNAGEGVRRWQSDKNAGEPNGAGIFIAL